MLADIVNDFIERTSVSQIKLRGTERVTGIVLITAGIGPSARADLRNTVGKNFRTQGGIFPGA